MKRSVLCLTVIVFLLSACEKSGVEKPQLYAKYRAVEVKSDTPIDLNFDGQANTDLTKEIDGLEKIALYFDRTNGYTDIIWMEPQLNDGLLYDPLPIEYNGIDNIKYQPVKNLFTYVLQSNGTVLLSRTNVIATRHYTFSHPQRISIDQRTGNLYFEASQQFLTEKDGIVTVGIQAEYQPEKEYIPEY
ncbi:hypothetical protein JHJ32_07440 [Parapedobacter sp. ISTM3]|uniref:hypothetical protein n=1 Tax=Parapedobacter sp. ISTM3 TaxID=2800130 RepID=UPI00190890AC|nr:hypothetical protein [Parapedobacter sp. ISTM3]MBK1439811.1 hypothetical protein [Parapedobacter sp. ISTM3]